MLHNRRLDRKDDKSDRPTLRRTPGSGPIDSDDDKKAPADQDERPTLKRRDS